MKNLAELRQSMTDVIVQARTIMNKAKDEGRSLTDEENSQVEALHNQAKALDTEIQLEERQLQLERGIGLNPNEPIKEEPDKNPEQRFGSFGEMLMAVYRASRPNPEIDPRLSTRAATGLSEGVATDGGFLIQPDFSSELLKRAYDTGVLASRCTRVPISSVTNALKFNSIDETSRVNGSRWGGIQAFWEGEAAELTGSKPKFKVVDLSLKKLTGLCYATDELLQDSVALEAIVSQGFSEEFGFQIDDVILNGTGEGQPLGIVPSAALVKVAIDTDQAAGTVTLNNVLNMYARLWARSQNNAIWLINQELLPQLYKLTLGDTPIFIPAGGLSGSPYNTLLGRPLMCIEQCEAAGVVGDILLADLSQYIMIDKGGIQAASSIHCRFIYDESVFRFIYRVDGRPLWGSALTPYKGANTLSPYVALAARK